MNGCYLYILPMNSKELFRFNTDNAHFDTIEFTFPQLDYFKSMFTQIAVAYKDYVYFIGHDVRGLYEINTNNNSINRYANYLESLKNIGVDINGDVFGDSFIQDNNILYVPVNGKNLMVCFDLSNRNYSIVQLEDKIRLRSIHKGKKGYILTTLDGELAEWIPGKNQVNFQNKYLIEGEKKSYFFALYHQGTYCYLPDYERNFFFQKGETVNKIRIDLIPEDYCKEKVIAQYEMMFISSNHLYFQAREDGTFFCFDFEKETLSKVDMKIQQDIRKEIVSDILRQSKLLINESGNIGVREFLEYL